MFDKIPKDIKLNIAKDLMASYVKSGSKENCDRMNIEEFCEAFKKVYDTVDQLTPENIERKIGLG